MKLLTLEQFIQKARKIHSSKYSYDKLVYTGMHVKAVFSCPHHGDFLQLPLNHIKGFGCKKCTKVQKGLQIKSYTMRDFMTSALVKFGDRFLYPGLVITTADGPIQVVCKIHGSFKTTPRGFLGSKYACEKCYHDSRVGLKTNHVPKNKKTTQQFKEHLSTTKPDIEVLGEYVDNNTKIKLRCKLDGHEWETRPRVLIKTGCPKCGLINSSASFIGINELQHFQPFIRELFPTAQFQEPMCGFFVDAYIPELKLVIEYDEPDHRYKLAYDTKRQRIIEKRMGVKFYRIHEEQFLGDTQWFAKDLTERYLPKGECGLYEIQTEKSDQSQ